jgi:hypothetical protein
MIVDKTKRSANLSAETQLQGDFRAEKQDRRSKERYEEVGTTGRAREMG